MDTKQLFDFGASCDVINKHFIGVFPSDYLSIIQHHHHGFPMSAIINLDDSTLPGTHWVAVYFNSNEEKEYMDSFGLPPPPVFRSILSTSYSYNKVILQNPLSTLCGGYCLYYLHYRSLKNKMSDVFSVFDSSNLIRNDLIVQKFMKSHYNFNMPLLDFSFFVD